MKSTKISAEMQYEKMTKTPVAKLISSLAVPTVISMMVTMIYNAADTYFVSKISIPASGATGIVFTLMGIIQACGFTFGHGAGSIISRLLGQKDIESAKKYCSTSFFSALFVGILISIFGLIFLAPFMRFIGSTETILPYSEIYGKYILLAAPAFVTSCVMNNILRYEGMAKLAMIGLTSGGILNMILDPILIFGFDMGIAGAGIATAFSQYISMGILLSVFILKKTQSRISIKYASLNPKMIWLIISTGAPSFARQSLNSLSTMVLNRTIVPYGDACIAAMSIVSKCSMAIFSIGVGIGQGYQPVSSFNYGAKEYGRVRKSMWFTWKFGTSVVGVLSALMFAFAPKIISLFRPEQEINEIGTAALRYLCVAMILLPTIMVANMTFQSVGKTGRALFLACSQNGLFYIPLIVIMNHLLQLKGIELAQPIAFSIAAFVSAPFLISFSKKLKENETFKKSE